MRVMRETVLAMLGAVLFVSASLATPHVLNFQGRLLDNNQEPLTAVVDLEFHVYEVPAGGAPLWSESHPAVQVTNGLFTQMLGSTTPITADLVSLPGGLDVDRFLEVVVNGTSLTPRLRIGAAPSAVSSHRVSGDIETGPGYINVGISEPIPDTRLHLAGRSGSTTGTIRMAATPDSASSLIATDSNDDGVIERFSWTQVGGPYARAIQAADLDGDGVAENVCTSSSDTGSASVSVSSRFAAGPRQSTSMDGSFSSASSRCASDLDGDGHPDVLAWQKVDNSEALSAVEVDVDDDGVPDVGSKSTAHETRSVLKTYFETGDVPTESQMIDSIDGNGVHSLVVIDLDKNGIPDLVAGRKCDDDVIDYADIDSDDDGVPEASSHLSTSPTGVQHTFTWNSAVDLGAEPNHSVRLRVTPIDAEVGAAADVDGDGVPEFSLVDKAEPALVSRVMTADLDADGVAEHSIDDDCDGISARSVFTGRSGSTTATIRQQVTPDSATSIATADLDADGNLDASVRWHVDGQGPIIEVTNDPASDNAVATKWKVYAPLPSVMSTRMSYADSPAEVSITDSIDASTARSIFKGMSGSTTGTIRMAASGGGGGGGAIGPSSELTLDADSDGDGVPESSIDDDCDGISARSAFTGRSGSTTGTIRMASSPDSGVSEISWDSDNDGIAESSLKNKGGSGGASSILSGMSGSTTGTIRMAATPDSGVLELGYSGSTTATIRMQASASGSANPIEHSSGAHLTAGGAWTNASDANRKENFRPVDGAALLDKISALKISQWNYKNERDEIKHIGPTAQDFKAIFGVGENDKSISTIDPAGIALAAIKQLRLENNELRAQVQELQQLVREMLAVQNNVQSDGSAYSSSASVGAQER